MSIRTQREAIQPDSNSSFRLMHNPRLSDLFFWHVHPELELVYIEGTNGTRHVGEHISPYHGSDLVLIGSNIPHLNFDYGVKTDYRKVVLHMQPAFIKNILGTCPELAHIHQLMDKARFGLGFFGAARAEAGRELLRLEQASPFEQFQTVLRVLDRLSATEEVEYLHETPATQSYNQKEQDRLKRVYAFVDQHYQRKISLEEVAELCNLTPAAFCRYFKKGTGHTFVSFLNRYRISQARRNLMIGQNVTETCFDCGFESLSYFTRAFKKITGVNPSSFKQPGGGG